MKIKLAILETDKIYMQRIVAAFNMKYADKLEIYSFTDTQIALNAIVANKIDIFLVNEFFEIDSKQLPARCSLAYLVDSGDIESIHNEKAIFKFQNAELIYKNILSIFSEKSDTITGFHGTGGETNNVIAFVSPAGGTGSSTAAAACAMNLAFKNKKVLYLNLESFGFADTFFYAEGSGDFRDIIYSVKSKKANIALKLESTVKQDLSGVYFYSSPAIALDMIELDKAEIKKLISDIMIFGGYDYIILDIDFSLDAGTLDILKMCNAIILISDGAEISNKKLERAVDSLNIIDQQTDSKMLLRCKILYNRVSSHNSSKLNIPDLKELGGIKRYEGYPVKQMLKEISQLAVFDSLANGVD